MATAIGSIIKRATIKKEEPYNILSFVTHERWSSLFAKTNAIFYMLQGGQGFGLKGKWCENYASVPHNHILLEPTDNPLQAIPSHIDFSFIISGHKFGQLQGSKELSKILQISIINVEHTMPTSPQLQQAIPELKKLNGDINVFISDFNRDSWGYSPEEAIVIEHGVDSSLFKPLPNIKKKNQIITVGNDMIGRSYILGFDIIQEILLNNKLPVNIIGDTKGLSRPAQNVFDLVRQLNESSIYFCPSRLSPISTSLLEGMSCGLCPVTTDNCVKSELIIDGYNGYKNNDNHILLNHLKRLLDNPDEAKQIGKNARETIIKRYNLDRFCSEWNSVFEKAAQIIK